MNSVDLYKHTTAGDIARLAETDIDRAWFVLSQAMAANPSPELTALMYRLARRM